MIGKDLHPEHVKAFLEAVEDYDMALSAKKMVTFKEAIEILGQRLTDWKIQVQDHSVKSTNTS